MTGKYFINKLEIALNVLYNKKMNMYPAYISKHNSNYEKKISTLMVRDG